MTKFLCILVPKNWLRIYVAEHFMDVDSFRTMKIIRVKCRKVAILKWNLSTKNNRGWRFHCHLTFILKGIAVVHYIPYLALFNPSIRLTFMKLSHTTLITIKEILLWQKLNLFFMIKKYLERNGQRRFTKWCRKQFLKEIQPICVNLFMDILRYQ